MPQVIRTDNCSTKYGAATDLLTISIWLGRHENPNTGLWEYNRAVLPWLLKELDKRVDLIEVTGAGEASLSKEVQSLCSKYQSVKFYWHESFLKNTPLNNSMGRHLGVISDTIRNMSSSTIQHGLSNTLPIKKQPLNYLSRAITERDSLVESRKFVTLHDILQLSSATSRSGLLSGVYGSVKRAFYKWYYKKLLTQMDLVFTGHEKTVEEIEKRFGDTISTQVVYPPLREEYLEDFDEQEKDDFFLAFISGDPRKNGERILKSFNELDTDISLVLVVSHEKVMKSLRKEISTLQKREQISLIFQPRTERVLQLYRSARATIFPSLGEGFGYPLYESLSQGTPVLAPRGLLAKPFLKSKQMVVECDPIDISSIKAGISQLISFRLSKDTVEGVRHELRDILHPRVAARRFVEGYFKTCLENAR